MSGGSSIIRFRGGMFDNLLKYVIFLVLLSLLLRPMRSISR